MRSGSQVSLSFCCHLCVICAQFYDFPVGDEKYREWAWDAFVAINATTRVGSGFSSISDVTVPGGGSFSNEQESFFFAEVLKYVYLIHAPVSTL